MEDSLSSISQLKPWDPGPEYQCIHLIPGKKTPVLDFDLFERNKLYKSPHFFEDGSRDIPVECKSQILQQNHQCSSLQTGLERFSNKIRESGGFLEYENPEKLFPYTGILDYSWVHIPKPQSETIPENIEGGKKSQPVSPLCLHCSKTLEGSILLRNGAKAGKSSPKIDSYDSIRVHLRYFGPNRFQRKDMFYSRILSSSFYFSSPDFCMGTEPICMLIVLSNLAMAFLRAIVLVSGSGVIPASFQKENTASFKVFQELSEGLVGMTFNDGFNNKKGTNFRGRFKPIYKPSRTFKNIFDISRPSSRIRTPTKIISPRKKGDSNVSSTKQAVNLQKLRDSQSLNKNNDPSPISERCMQCLDTIGTLDKINQNRSGLDRILNLDKNIFQELNFMEPARNISPSSQMVMEDIDVSFMAKNNLEKFSSSFQRRNSQNWVFIQNNLGPKIPSGKLSSRISSVKMERRVSLRRMSLRRNSSKLPSKSHSADHITSVNSSSLTSKNVLKSKSTPVYYKKTSVLESLRNYIPTSEICATKVDFYNRGGELRLKKSYYKKYPAQRPRGYKSLVPKKRRISWSSLECSTNDPIQLPVKQFENITGRASNENRIRTFERRLKKIKLDILKIDEGVYKKISSPGFFSDKSTVEADKRYLEINPFGSRPKGRDAFSHHDIADKSLRKEIPTEGKFSKLSSKESSSFSLIGPSFNYNQARELEEGKHVRRLSVLLSHFPISSSELCSATSVLELPITQKLMPLNVDCLDDPVTALRIGNFPSIHHGHDENKDTSSKDPHLGIGYPIAVVQNINWISLSTKESDSQESPTVNFKDSFSKTKTSIDTSLDRGLQHFISSGSDNSLSRRRVPNTNGLLIKAGQEMQAYFSGNIGTGNTLSNSEDDVFHDVMSPDNDSEETKNGSPAQDHLYSATRFKDKSMLPVWQEKFSASSNLETVGSSPETFTDAINTAGEFSLENHDSIDLGKADVFSSSYPKSILLDSKKHESETAYPKKVRFSLTRTLFEKDHVKCHQLPSINMKTLERRLSSKTGGIDHTRSNFRKGTLGNYSPPRDSMNSSVEQTAILDTFSRDIYSAVVTDKDIDDDFEKEAESSTVAIVRILTLSKSGELRPHFFQYVNGSLRNLGSGSSTKCERL